MFRRKAAFQFAFLVAFTCASIQFTHAQLDISALRVIRTANLGKTKIGMYAVDLDSGYELLRHNADTPMMPASNMKLITTAASLHTLGKDFAFETKLFHLSGNADGATLLVQGDGDPAFGDDYVLRNWGVKVKDVEQFLNLWVSAVKKAGIRRVSTLLVDDSVFDRNFVHSTWPRDQLNRWYCAQVAGLNFYTNCVDVYPEPTLRGESPYVRVMPSSPFLPTTNLAKTGSADTFWISRKIGSNEIAFRGSVKHRRTKPVHVTIHDPAIYFCQVLAERLLKAGVRVDKIARVSPTEDRREAKTLHVIRTPLSIVLTRCNKFSQNLYAESLFKRMGRKLTGTPGSFRTGGAAVRLYLQKQIGTAAASVNSADGSGLSRENRVTSRIMVQVLEAMHKNEKTGKLFRQSMAVAGQDGTVAKRMRNVKARVYAKTGYINGVSCLSGYIVLPRKKALAANASSAPSQLADADDGKVIAFSFLFNNIRPSLSAVMGVQDQLVALIASGYQR